jgi:NAD(P)-dependent dehydrogenase (short-subunit alcohol dehydrogenase family)
MPNTQLMSDKICLVTGATSGIGRATAIALAELGATVVVAGRNERLGRETAEEIRAVTGGRPADYLIADLSSQREVRELARRFRERYPRLDVLVNNAGVITRERTVTGDGIETQLAVNHLAPFLLTHLLVDLLRATSPARIVTVASQVEASGTIDFEDIGGERHYDPIAAYSQSKLANVLFTYELARRLEGSGVTANCLHPGVIATQLLDDYLGRPRMLRFVARLRNPGPAEGARTSVYLASSPEVERVSGKYFVDSRPATSSSRSRDPDLAKKLWEFSAKLTSV